jgi:protein-tyrosine-phosphatase
MSKQLIEFVCSYNNGRSPIAELIATNHLKEISAPYHAAISSGSHIADKREPSIEFKLDMINKAAQNPHVYSAGELSDLNEGIILANDDIINDFYKKAIEYFQRKEVEHRTLALKEFGIEGKLKETQDATIVRPNIAAIFTMAKENKEKVTSLYHGSGHNPMIEVLSSYATGDPDEEIPNTFGKGQDVYFEAVEKLTKQVPLAINRLF